MIMTSLVRVQCILLFIISGSEVVSKELEWSQTIEDNINGYIENVMSCREIPGLAVSVVSTDEFLYERVFGYADLGNSIPATTESKFCIGSLGKAIATTFLGSILAEYNSTYPDGYDSKLKDIFGSDFQLGDDYFTNSVTFRDMLSHRSGLATYIGALIVMVEGTYPRQEYCNRMKYFAQISELRTDFSYNNWMFMMALCVAEKITGQTFAEVIQERIFSPLNMTDTILSQFALEPGVLPTSYYRNESSGEIKELNIELVDIFPADSGSVCGPVTDVSKWLKFLLKDDKSSILPTELWLNSVSPQIPKPRGNIFKPQFPVTEDQPNYGLGWQIGTYRGYKKNFHTGTLSGYQSLVSIFPDMNFAIFTSSNGLMYNGDAHSVIHYYISDLLLEMDTWLDNTTSCTFPEPWSRTERKSNNNCQNQDESSLISDYVLENEKPFDRFVEWSDPYVGQFGHPFMGNITFSFDESSQQLRFVFGKFGEGYIAPNPVLEDWFDMHLEGSLEYFHVAGPNVGLYPPVYFRNLIGNNTNGLFEEFVALGMEPTAPPVFYRNFQWDDSYPPQ